MALTAEALGFAQSPFVKVAVAREGVEQLMLVFSHVEEPAGRFTFERSATQLGWNAIFLNIPDRSYYLRGIPGLGADLEASIATLRAAVARIAPARICALGTSMGGFGAALFGAALGIDRVLAIGAETELMLRGSRSRGFIADRFKPAVADLRPAIAAAVATRFLFMVGETDVADIHAAARVSDLRNVTALSVRNAEHEVGRWLARRDKLLGFLEAFATEGTTLESFLDLGDVFRDPLTATALQRGNDALLRFKPAEAIGPLLAAIGVCPRCAVAHHLLGRAYALRGRHDAALRAHARAIALDGETAALPVSLADALIGAGRDAEAERTLGEVVAAHPRAAAAHHTLAQLRARRGDAAGAGDAMRIALEIEPRNALYLSTHADLLAGQSRWDEAAAALGDAVAINPLRGELFVRLAIAQARRGAQDAASEAFARAMALEPENAAFKRLAQSVLSATVVTQRATVRPVAR
jgi:Tfp pilus assembly protein PilF